MRDVGDTGGASGRTMPWRLLSMALLCMLTAVWLVWGPLGIIFYVGGLFNSMLVFVVMFLSAFLILTAIAAFPVLIVYAAVTWRRTRHGRRALILWITLTGGFVVPLIFGLAGLTSSPKDMFIRGFSGYVQRRVDVPAVQEWLATLKPNPLQPGQVHPDICVEESDLPASIACLRAWGWRVEFDDADRPRIRLMWGSGMTGSWGLVVGHRQMATPASNFSRHGEVRRTIAPGTYVWYDMR